MKKALFAVVTFLCLSLSAFAQDTLWSRTYGGSEGNSSVHAVQQTTDGGYIVVGGTAAFGAGEQDVYLIKTNSNGDTLWSRTYGGSSGDLGRSVQQTTDGGYIVAGMTESFGGGDDFYLIKTDSIGDLLWSRSYRGGTEQAYSVQQTADGGYIVAGGGFITGLSWVFYLIKTNSTGDLLWSRTYGGDELDYGHSVQQTADGGYIVAGRSNSFSGNIEEDVYLIKTNSIGDIVWNYTYGGIEYDDAGYSVQQTTDGGYIVVGYTRSFGSSGKDVYLIKTYSNGNIQWSRAYENAGSWDEYGWSVQQTTDGGYIVAGYSSGDVYVIKTNSTGDPLWSRIYGGDGGEYAFSVQQTTDGGYIVAEYTYSFGVGDKNVMLTKLDSLGNTCIGEFVSSTVIDVSPTVINPATVVGSPSTEVITPTTIVTSPPTVVTTVCPILRGDANGDGVINSADVVYLINFLFAEGPEPLPLEAGDANCDGVVDSADVVYLINYLFAGGPAPGC